MKFILQRENADVISEQGWALVEAQRYYEWKGDPFEIKTMCMGELKPSRLRLLDNHPEEWCPVGTIEFVLKYIEVFFGEKKRKLAEIPCGVAPECYYGRRIFKDGDVVNPSDVKTRCYVKGLYKLKDKRNGYMDLGMAKDIFPEGYIATELIDLVSEWRGFVHNGELVDIKNYSGDPFAFPDKHVMGFLTKDIVKIQGLKEGTIDVAVTSDSKTVFMESHKFFSCGLYGFSQAPILPLMYWRTYKDLIS